MYAHFYTPIRVEAPSQFFDSPSDSRPAIEKLVVSEGFSCGSSHGRAVPLLVTFLLEETNGPGPGRRFTRTAGTTCRIEDMLGGCAHQGKDLRSGSTEGDAPTWAEDRHV